MVFCVYLKLAREAPGTMHHHLTLLVVCLGFWGGGLVCVWVGVCGGGVVREDPEHIHIKQGIGPIT